MLSRDVKRLILRVHLDLCFCMGHCFTSHWESAPIGVLFQYMLMIIVIYDYIHNWIRYSYSFSAEAKHCTFECMLRRSASGKFRPRKESLQLYCCSMLPCKDHSSFSFVILVCWFDSCLGCKSDSSSPLNTLSLRRRLLCWFSSEVDASTKWDCWGTRDDCFDACAAEYDRFISWCKWYSWYSAQWLLLHKEY